MARRRRGDFGYIIGSGRDGNEAPFKIRWREGGKHRKKSGYRTKTDAQAALHRIHAALADGTLVAQRRASIGLDSVAQDWLRLHSAPALRSHKLNLHNYTRHIKPFFADCPLRAVTPAKILELRAELQAKHVTHPRRPKEKPRKLSAQTVNTCLALVRSILRFAAANGHVDRSPTDLMGRGKLMLPIARPKLDPPIGRPEDVGRLLEAIREIRPDRYALFATLLYTGLRKGEAAALRWSDVDLPGQMIHVQRSYAGPTKSGKERDVPVPARLKVILEAHKLAEPWGTELLFPNEEGEMFTKNGHWEDALRAALDRTHLPRIRLHDLRHTYAAMFIMAGGSLFDLSKNLGHHSVAFTAQQYGHLSSDHRVAQADRLSFDAPEAGRVVEIVRARG